MEKIKNLPGRPKLEFNRALQLYPAKESEWKPEVKLCSALYNEGVSDIWKMISEFKAKVDENGYFQHNRLEQNKFWLFQTMNDYLKSRFYEDPKDQDCFKRTIRTN